MPGTRPSRPDYKPVQPNDSRNNYYVIMAANHIPIVRAFLGFFNGCKNGLFARFTDVFGRLDQKMMLSPSWGGIFKKNRKTKVMLEVGAGRGRLLGSSAACWVRFTRKPSGRFWEHGATGNTLIVLKSLSGGIWSAWGNLWLSFRSLHRPAYHGTTVRGAAFIPVQEEPSGCLGWRAGVWGCWQPFWAVNGPVNAFEGWNQQSSTYLLT